MVKSNKRIRIKRANSRKKSIMNKKRRLRSKQLRKRRQLGGSWFGNRLSDKPHTGHIRMDDGSHLVRMDDGSHLVRMDDGSHLFSRFQKLNYSGVREFDNYYYDEDNKIYKSIYDYKKEKSVYYMCPENNINQKNCKKKYKGETNNLRKFDRNKLIDGVYRFS